MTLLRRLERRNNSRQHLWDELENLDTTVDAIVASEVIGNTLSAVDNTGASGITTFNLPSAAVGMEYVISREASFTYRINPNGIEYFQGSSAGLYKSLDTDAAYINIKCLRAGIWHVMASAGTITDE